MDKNKFLDIFHTEMGKNIYYLNEYIKLLKFNGKNQQVFKILTQKIIKNTTSANILIYEECFEEAQIILRSALETLTLIIYLFAYPEEILSYIIDSEILAFKNTYIVYKQTYDGEINDLTGEIYYKEELKKNHENFFNILSKESQEKILKEINISEYIINNETEPKIDKYFTKNLKPTFECTQKMYKKLNNINYKIGKYSIKDLLFEFYNLGSQVAHGSFFAINKKPDVTDFQYLYHCFFKLTVFLGYILEKEMNIKQTDEILAIKKESEKAIQKLQKLVYGKVL